MNADATMQAGVADAEDIVRDVIRDRPKIPFHWGELDQSFEPKRVQETLGLEGFRVTVAKP
jgi:hypothetical protein